MLSYDLPDPIEAVTGSSALYSNRPVMRDLTLRANRAAVTPKVSGFLSHAKRASLAARIAHSNGEIELSAFYRNLLTEMGADTSLIDVSTGNAAPAGDETFKAAVEYTDLITKNPAAANAETISNLRGIGLTESDVVTLAELVAFINYQTRITNGLALLKGQIA